jgi:nucleotide-binding universal stress UspA family protein
MRSLPGVALRGPEEPYANTGRHEILGHVMRTRPVLCAIDEGEVSRHAVEAAAWLAQDLDTGVVLAHAFDPMGIPARPRPEMLARGITDADLEDVARRAARLLLRDAATRVAGVEVATELVEGQVVPELLELAEARWATLLVAGTAARGGIERMLLGSVSGALAQAAPCPVIAVQRGAALQEPGPVVAGYDGSAHSLRAARHAASLAARLGRELVLLHVTRGEGVEPDEELARELYAAGVGGLGDDPGRPAPDLKVRLEVEEGEPVQVLAAVGREQSAALLVTGTRGRSALSSALLGSVSVGLVGAAGRPVALVPATAGETPAG